MDKDEQQAPKNEPDEEAEIKKKPGIGSKMNHQSIIQGQNSPTAKKTTRKTMNLRTRRTDSPKEKGSGDDGQMKRPMMLRLNSENSAVKSVNKVSLFTHEIRSIHDDIDSRGERAVSTLSLHWAPTTHALYTLALFLFSQAHTHTPTRVM